MVLNKRATAVLAAGVLAFSSAAILAAESVNFVSWGGSTQDFQKEAWAAPFSKASGITVVQDGPTDYGKLKAMVESGNVQWDVVDVEADFACVPPAKVCWSRWISTPSSATKSTNVS